LIVTDRRELRYLPIWRRNKMIARRYAQGYSQRQIARGSSIFLSRVSRRF
jgi:hypothetical protein